MPYYVLIPGGDQSFIDKVLEAACFLVAAAGAIYGGWDVYTNHASVPEATGHAIAIEFYLCSLAGQSLVNLKPDSSALSVIGDIVKWLFGVIFGLFVGFGAFLGGGVVWVVVDIFLKH